MKRRHPEIHPPLSPSGPPGEVTHCGHDGEEELGAVGTGPPIGHTERVRAVVSQSGVELVLKLAAPDALTAHTGARGVPRLHHESLIGRRWRLY